MSVHRSRKKPPLGVPACVVACCCVALSLAAGPSSVAAPGLGAQIRKAVASDTRVFERAGIRVVSLPDGEVVYASPRAAELFIPASNQKLLVSAAAIELLGAGHRFSTRLARRGDDVVIIGDGDPGTGDPMLAEAAGEPITAIFHAWAAALQQTGITGIRGDLVIDDFAFDDVRVHPAWSKGDLLKWYAAPVGGLNFNDNCIDVTVVPGAKPGGPTSVRVVPGNTLTRIVNRSKTGGKGSVVITRKGMTHAYVLSGRCSKTATLQSVPVVDPGLFFGSACRTALAAKGIRIEGEIRRERVRTGGTELPPDCTLIATHETSLIDNLVRMNKRSQNLFAECILKTLGRHHRRGSFHGPDLSPVGTWAAGSEAVAGLLERVSADAAGLVIDDGSGLSRNNRVSPKQITDLLTHMFSGPQRDVFIDTLAVSGVDGTLRKRMSDIRGRVHAKTGYISGVRTLSGYVEGQSGRWFAFSFLFNDKKPRIGTRPATNMQNKLCRILAGA